MDTVYLPVMGEVAVNENPILKELYWKMSGDALAALNKGRAVVMVLST